MIRTDAGTLVGILTAARSAGMGDGSILDVADWVRSLHVTLTPIDDAITRSFRSELYLQSCSSIASYAFYQCDAIRSLSAGRCESVGYAAFFRCPNITEVLLPSCKAIGSRAFYGCGSLASVDLGSCKTLYQSAFYSCTSLGSISLPKCESIGSFAFYRCGSLSVLDLTGVGSVPSAGSNFLAYTPMERSTYTGAYGSILVPASLYGRFASDPSWSLFSRRIVAL